MTNQRIIQGDCLDVFANERNIEAFVSDPPANIGFMGRSWDKSQPATDYVLPCKPRSKAHESILRKKESFIRYWYERYSMAYDVADQHSTALIWTLPQTSHQTAEALERAGWEIKANIVHLFGTGWAKSGNALAPGQEGWLLATKGKPDLDIDACRVPRGAGESTARDTGTNQYFKGKGRVIAGGSPLGSLPKNALLSHCEECVRVGSRDVKASAPPGKPTAGTIQNSGSNAYGDGKPRGTSQYGTGTESVPAWHCLAGCSCGARAPWPDDRPLTQCPCGETWRWLCPVAEVNAQSGESIATVGKKNKRVVQTGMSVGLGSQDHETGFADQGGAARFFNTFSYLSKCSSSERHAGCENLFWKANKKNPFGFDQVTREEWEALPTYGGNGKDMRESPAHRRHDGDVAARAQGNVHPTVKSYRLMHWLHSLTGAKRIGDLCGGSGTGMIAAYLDGIEWIGAEMCPEAITIANARLAWWKGLSFEARDAFMRDDLVPGRTEAHAAQTSLFEART